MFDFISKIIFNFKYSDKIINNEKVKQIFDENNSIIDFNRYLVHLGYYYKEISFIENFNKSPNEFFATSQHNCLDFTNIYKNFCNYKNIKYEQLNLKKPWTLTYHTCLIIFLNNDFYLMSNNIISVFPDKNSILEFYKNKGYIQI